MKDIAKELTQTLKSIHAESYNGMNTRKGPVYPYLTYTIHTEALDRNQEGVELELNLFDRSTSVEGVFDLEEKLKDALKFKRDMTPKLYLRYEFRNSLDIPTLVPDLQRRNVTFYVKIDERTKHYGTT